MTVPVAGLAAKYSSSLTSAITISVLEAREAETIIEWRYGRPEFPAAAGVKEEDLPQSYFAFFEFAPRFRLDHQKKTMTLQNIDDAKAWLIRYADVELELLRKRGATPEIIEGFRGTYKAIANDPALLQTTVMTRPLAWFSALWHSGAVGTTEVADAEIPNPFVEGTMRVRRSVSVTREPDSSFLRFVIVSEPSRSDVLNMARAALSRAGGKPLDADTETQLEAAHFRYAIEMEVTVDPANGWPESVSYTNGCSYDGGGTKETIKLVRRHATEPKSP